MRSEARGPREESCRVLDAVEVAVMCLQKGRSATYTKPRSVSQSQKANTVVPWFHQLMSSQSMSSVRCGPSARRRNRNRNRNRRRLRRSQTQTTTIVTVADCVPPAHCTPVWPASHCHPDRRAWQCHRSRQEVGNASDCRKKKGGKKRSAVTSTLGLGSALGSATRLGSE